MYKSFNIKNFRGIRYLTIEPMARVNLIAGANNVGKTAVLEALWMHHAPNVPDTGFRVNRFRGLVSIDPNRLLWELFTNLDASSLIQFSARGDWGDEPRTLMLRLEDRETTEVPIKESREGTEFGGGASDSRTSRQEIVYEYTDENGETHDSRGYFVATRVGPGMLEEAFRSERKGIGQKTTGVFLAARHRGGQEEEIK